MNTEYLKRDLINRGARLARGDHLGRLEQRAHSVHRMRSTVIEKELERVRDQMRDDAVLMRKAFDAIRELEKKNARDPK